MRYQCWTVLMALLLGAAVGCGSSNKANESQSKEGDTQDSSGPTASAAAEPSGPDGAVTRFLEAVRTGNDEVATKMFTPLARQKASELGIQVAPRGSDTARFEVGKVEMVGTDGARVTSTWTDLDKNGQKRSDNITWMVRHETEGWRVAGMAAVVFEGEPPLLLDFEQPEETMKRLDMLREEAQRRLAKEKPDGQHSQPGQGVQQAEHVAAGGNEVVQPLRPAGNQGAQFQQPVDNRGQQPALPESQPAPGRESRVQEAKRGGSPSDPFQR